MPVAHSGGDFMTRIIYFTKPSWQLQRLRFGLSRSLVISFTYMLYVSAFIVVEDV